MSLRDLNLKDDNLKDAHLTIALHHAPDSDVAPSDATQKMVLDYADKIIKPRRESWFSRLISAFNAWQVPRWQLTGMGSLAASLLVVVMIWHENPDDPIQVATAPAEVIAAAPIAEPKPAPKLEQGELASDDLNQAEQSLQVAAAPASEVASAEIAAPKAQDKMQAKAVAKTKSAKAEAAPQAAAIEASADKTVVASAPEAASTQDEAKDADSTRFKERTESNEVASMPALVMESAPAASIEASGDAMSKQVAPSNKAVKKMAEAEAQSEAKSDNSRSDVFSAAAAKPALTRNIILAQAIRQEGGKALAIKDIQTGDLRILYLSKNAPAGAPLLDEVTGYRMEFIADDAANLAAEVAAYNQTMRDWHLNQNQ